MFKYILTTTVLFLASFVTSSQANDCFQLEWETNFLNDTHTQFAPISTSYSLSYNSSLGLISGTNNTTNSPVNLWHLDNSLREKDLQAYKSNNIFKVNGTGLRIVAQKENSPSLDNITFITGGVQKASINTPTNWTNFNHVSTCSTNTLAETFSLNTNREINQLTVVNNYFGQNFLALTTDGGGISFHESCNGEFGWHAENGLFDNETILPGFLPDLNTNCIINHPVNNDLLVGTNSGVFYSQNFGNSWSLLVNSNTPVHSFISTSRINRRILVLRVDDTAFFIKDNFTLEYLNFPLVNQITGLPYKIYSAIQFSNYIYAACENGLFRMNLNNTIPNWSSVYPGEIVALTVHNNQLYIFDQDLNSVLKSTSGSFGSFLLQENLTSGINGIDLENTLSLNFNSDKLYIVTTSKLIQKNLSSSQATNLYNAPPGQSITDFLISNNELYVTTKFHKYPLHAYSSGSMHGNFDGTYPDLNVHYGYIEAKIRFSDTYGLFPAFWTWKQENSIGEANWDYDEIDIIELVPGMFQNCPVRNIDNITHDKYISTSNLHTFFDDYIENTCSLTSFEDYGRVHTLSVPYTQFNIYGLEWTPNRIRWYFNNQLIREESNPDMNQNLIPDLTQPTNLILNQAISSFVRWNEGIEYNPSSPDFSQYFVNPNYSGPSDLNINPSNMDIEFVRYFKPKLACASDFTLNQTTIEDADNSVYRNVYTSGSSFNINNNNIHIRANQSIVLNINFSTQNGKEYAFDIFSCY